MKITHALFLRGFVVVVVVQGGGAAESAAAGSFEGLYTPEYPRACWWPMYLAVGALVVLGGGPAAAQEWKHRDLKVFFPEGFDGL